MFEPIQQVKADFFKALAHPARIRILELLSEGEMSVSELVDAIGLESSHVSQQLGVLRRANLVVGRKEGTSVYYSLADLRIAEILATSKAILVSYLTTTVDLFSDLRR
jgi:DNA-binding transcriptional ArsR family regulator